jgi:hypothetical protein
MSFFTLRGKFRGKSRPNDAKKPAEEMYQSSLVRILHDGEELKAARRRAINFERLAITAVSERISRYRELDGEASVISISEAGAREAPDTDADTA